MPHFQDFLRRIIRARVDDASWSWFEKAEGYARKLDPDRLLGAYTAASRKLGKQALLLDSSERTELRQYDPMLVLDHWGMDEAGRALLLLAAAKEADALLLLKFYELGDAREQQSWLRCLCLLPKPERFLQAAVDACRTNMMPVFEAIACENPYPYRFFPELNFNQMVLKALFNQVALARIVGLERRFNPELSRMADDYVTERERASRPVPPDIWLVAAPHAGGAQLERVVRYLGHDDPQHRYWAAVGLGHAEDPAARRAVVRRALENRRTVEADPRVRQAIEQSLNVTA